MWLRSSELKDTNNCKTEKAMAPHSSTLAWKTPWMEQPCRLQSMGSLRVRHDWATSLSLFTFMHWRRKWQPTLVFLPGESQGWEARWAAVYRVTESQIWLKWLSSSSKNFKNENYSEGEENLSPWNMPLWHCYCYSVPQLCLTLCDSMGCSTPGFPVLQHTRLPCPSLSPRVCSNFCPLSRWCHPTISSSVALFSSSSLPASGSFSMSQLFTSGGQSIGASASASVLPKNI